MSAKKGGATFRKKSAMQRSLFLTITSAIAFTIGVIALIFPGALLESKGVTFTSSTPIWVMEVGVLLLTQGIILFTSRHASPSTSLDGILISGLIIQGGLLSIELYAYQSNIITLRAGILPNAILHTALIVGFCYYLLKRKKETTPLRKN